MASGENGIEVLAGGLVLTAGVFDAGIHGNRADGHSGLGGFELDKLQLQHVGQRIITLLLAVGMLAQETVELLGADGTAVPYGNHVFAQFGRLRGRRSKRHWQTKEEGSQHLATG